MTLKQTAKIYVLLSVALGCLNVFGQPTSSAPVIVVSNRPAAKIDPDSLPVRTIASVTREWSTQNPSSNQVVHLRGAILDQRVGEYLVIRDDTGTILAESSQTLSLKMQTVVDLWGSPGGDLSRRYLRRANFREVPGQITAGTNAVVAQKPANLPVLTNVLQIRELSPTEAGWEYPVKLRGVLTLAYQHTRTYFEDSTAGIYVRSRQFRSDYNAGDVVEIEGFSNPGWFAPIVVPTKMTVVGKGPLPAAPEVSLFQMANGQYDSQWVEADAVVRGVHVAAGITEIKLSDRDGTFIAKLPSDNAPTNLVDAVVRVRGVCVSLFNNKRQITGVEMWVPSMDLIDIKESGAEDPLSLAAQPIISLSQSHPRATLQRRVKVAGIVTASEPGKSFFIQDADDGIEIFPAEKTAVKTGDRIEAAGYVSLGDYGTILRDAVCRVNASGVLPAAKPVTREVPLDPQLNNLWVETDAQVTSDPEVDAQPVLTLQLGNAIFKAHILDVSDQKLLPAHGSMVHLAGVYQVLTDDLRAPRSFQIIVPSDQNLHVTNHPSMWTLQHTMLLVGTFAVTAGIALLWVLLLRRKVSEQTAILQQSEMKFRTLVEQSLVGVYVIQDGRFVYANPRMAEIYGYSVEEFTSPSLTVKETITDEDWPTVEAQIHRRLNGEIASAHYTLRARRKDGFLINVEVMGSLGKYNGKPAILGTTMDITDRKLAESKLAEASNLLETLMDNSPDYIYFKDRACRFVRVSKAFENLFHLKDIKDIRGKTDFDYFLVEHARAAYEDEQEVMRTGKALVGKLEPETHPDGRVTYALTTKVPWRDNNGNVVGTFGISKDVTALKEAEAKLGYERDLFVALLQNFPDLIYFKDLKSRFVRVSRSKSQTSMEIVLAQYRSLNPKANPDDLPSYLKSTEKFGDWLIGKTDFDTFTKDRAQAAFDDEQKIIQTGEPVVGKIERTLQADGKVTWCISTKMPWRDKNGQIIGTFGVSKDITALKEAEAELEAAHQRLVETSRLAGMAEIATGVLHNVGNVLNSVNVSCSLTIDRVKTSKISSLAKKQPRCSRNTADASVTFSRTTPAASKFLVTSRRFPNILSMNNPDSCRNWSSSSSTSSTSNKSSPCNKATRRLRASLKPSIPPNSSMTPSTSMARRSRGTTCS